MATERFAYALVSAAPLQDTDAAGIAVVFKAPDRSTIGTICQALPATDPLEAAYEAVMRVLDEALHRGIRRFTIYTDINEMVAQLTSDAPVPRRLLVKHLKARGTINQVGDVKFVTATSNRFSARLIAESARLPEGTPSAPRRTSQDGRQLELLAEDALA